MTDLLLYIEKSQVRKMDLFTQYAMAAAAQAMEDRPWALRAKWSRSAWASISARGVGGMNTFVEDYDTLYKGPKGISPFFITKLITRSPLGQCCD